MIAQIAEAVTRSTCLCRRLNILFAILRIFSCVNAIFLPTELHNNIFLSWDLKVHVDWGFNVDKSYLQKIKYKYYIIYLHWWFPDDLETIKTMFSPLMKESRMKHIDYKIFNSIQKVESNNSVEQRYNFLQGKVAESVRGFYFNIFFYFYYFRSVMTL